MKIRYSILFILAFIPAIEAQERIVLSRMEGPLTMYGVIGMRVLEEAYSRIGVDIEFRELPGERSLMYANAGNTDGEFVRTAGIEKLYPNLIMLSVPIRSENVVIYTKEIKLRIGTVSYHTTLDSSEVLNTPKLIPKI